MKKRSDKTIIMVSMGIVLFFTFLIPPVTANAQNPSAAFYGMPTSGNVPLTVVFMDESTGSPNGWAWYFGDENFTATWTLMNAGTGWLARDAPGSVAMPDGSIVLMGGYNGSICKNDTWRSTDNGSSWTLMNASSGWSPRAAHGSVAMPDGSIVLMGGWDPIGGIKNDTWQSKDNGATWTLINASSGWTRRSSHTSVVMPDGSIVLMGGASNIFKNDVWRSTDYGATWKQVNASAGWMPRQDHTSVAMADGSIVLMGGWTLNPPNYKNDTWRSTNGGATWTLVNASSGWTARTAHTSVAMPDGSVVLMGGVVDLGIKKNDVWRSSDNGATWTKVNASAGWTARYYPSSVVMSDGRIVLMGGLDGGGFKHDVWRSSDNGATWTQIKGDFTVRNFHSSVVMPDGTIVLMGGIDKMIALKNDVWRSTDKGVIWTQVNWSAGWTPRRGHTSVVMPDNSIVLMGGMDANNVRNDVWRSTDKGATWTRVNASPGWTARFLPSSVAMPDGSILLMGGLVNQNLYKNDTWRSTDNGATWTQVNASAGWTPRYGHSSVAMPDGTIVLMGGEGLYGTPMNDVWLSINNGAAWTRVNAGAELGFAHSSVAMPDGSIVLMGGANPAPINNNVWRSTDGGVTWKRVNSSSGWTARSGHSSVAMPDGSIVLMGGTDSSSDKNDAWRFNPVGSSLQIPSHTYTTPGIYTVALQAYNAGGYNSTIKSGYINVTKVTASKIGVFRNSTHLFYLDYNGNGVWNGAGVDRQYNFGISGDLPSGGDWNLDGRTEIGVFRNATHLFYLDYNGNGVWNGGINDRQYNFGITGDIPRPGDWNADGRTEIGVYRPSTHMFYLDLNGNGVWNGAGVDRQYNFGITGDIPVAGDWNLDGRTEIGVFRNSTHLFYLDYNGNGVWNGASIDRQYNFGITGDIPRPGDWNADGKTEIGVFRPSTHLFYLDYNGNGVWNGASTDRQYNFGITGDKPISGKW